MKPALPAALALLLAGPAAADSFVDGGVLYDGGSPRLAVGVIVEPDDSTLPGSVAGRQAAVDALAPAGLSPLWYTPGGSDAVLDATEALLQQAADHGVNVMLGLFNQDPAGDAAFNRPAIIDSPGLLGYYHTDDGDQHHSPQQVAARDAAVRAVDPDHVTAYSLTDTGTDDAATVAAFAGPAGSLLLGQSYPITHQSLGEPYHDARRVADAARANGQAPGLILQAFDWGNDFGDFGLGDRPPTGDELRAMSYLALAGGARSLFFYTFNPADQALPDRHPELFDVIAALPGELRPVERAVLLGAESRLAEGEGGLFATRFDLPGEAVVIAVNTADAAVDVDLPLAVTPARRRFVDAGATLDLAGGSLRGTLPAGGFSVVRVVPNIPDPSSALALPFALLLLRIRP